jgi:limonene-1,2-epoxide hydrolase
MNPAISAFRTFYESLDKDRLDRLGEVYDRDVVFCDPVHEIHGIDALRAYFAGMVGELTTCRFVIEDVLEGEGEACARWVMYFRHRRLRRGAEIAVPGVSYLRFRERVHYHRDYFDLGALLYEHIPILGVAVRALKNRLAS